MGTLLEILSPSFLLRDALYSSIVIGLLCPIVGVFLVLRRMIFLAVTLPQVSAAGIALVFLAFSLFSSSHDHGGLDERSLALIGSFSVTIGAIFILVWFEGNRLISSEAKVGIVYACASAATVVLLASDPAGEAQMVNLLKGDMLAATQGSLLTLLAGYIAVSAFVLTFSRSLVLVFFDSELARVFGMSIGVWNLAFYLCVGITVSLGVMSAGPLVIFGYLTLPALIARNFAHHIKTLLMISSLVGGASALAGFYTSYLLDLPLGPVQVAFMGALYFFSGIVRVFGSYVTSK